jgi:hypothetical protein
VAGDWRGAGRDHGRGSPLPQTRRPHRNVARRLSRSSSAAASRQSRSGRSSSTSATPRTSSCWHASCCPRAA